MSNTFKHELARAIHGGHDRYRYPYLEEPVLVRVAKEHKPVPDTLPYPRSGGPYPEQGGVRYGNKRKSKARDKVLRRQHDRAVANRLVRDTE